jgi:DegV family protein with EDD domain
MKIVTDCAADMSQEELKELGITEAPLYIQFPDGEISSKDITADTFYDRLEAMQPNTPTTAMPSSGLFTEMYNKIAKIDKDILSLHISSGLSGTINAARGAAEQIKNLANVNFWDTLTLSGGERFQVIAAALAARAGWTMNAIQERLVSIRSKTEVIYTLDTLDYLERRQNRPGQSHGRCFASFEANHPCGYGRQVQLDFIGAHNRQIHDSHG